MLHSDFEFEMTVSFADADPAGIMFYGTIFKFHHQALELYVTKTLKITYKDWFLNPDLGVPITKTEAQYFKPLIPGVKYVVKLNISNITSGGFTAKSEFFLQTENSKASRAVAMVETQHICVDFSRWQKEQKLTRRNLPNEWTTQLSC